MYVTTDWLHGSQLKRAPIISRDIDGLGLYIRVLGLEYFAHYRRPRVVAHGFNTAGRVAICDLPPPGISLVELLGSSTRAQNDSRIGDLCSLKATPPHYHPFLGPRAHEPQEIPQPSTAVRRIQIYPSISRDNMPTMRTCSLPSTATLDKPL